MNKKKSVIAIFCVIVCLVSIISCAHEDAITTGANISGEARAKIEIGDV